jgi:hypothetical protein
MAVLATAASAATECPVIAHEFAQPGTYGLLLHRSVSTGSACDQAQSHSYRLRVSKEAR